MTHLIPIYDKRLDYYSPIERTPLQHLAALVGVTLEPVTLDVGCGDGRSAQWLPQVVGVDYSGARIDKARRTYPDHEWVHTDMMEWFHRDVRTFQSAILIEVLEHVTDPTYVLVETRRRVAGPVLATVPVGIDDETHLWDWTEDEAFGLFLPDRWARWGSHVVMAWQ